MQRFKIDKDKLFWILVAGAFIIPVLVILWETNFGSASAPVSP
ncbi:MAG TPA: hypothetical protein VHC19_04905 [Pirellulales bacterium]|jgi:hypothetical protein|nr:hypothetical protein [Pirellulales bacterium]